MGMMSPISKNAVLQSLDGDRAYARVAIELAQSIIAGRYAVGQRLPSERSLVSLFGISRPTLREALVALEIAGFVQIKRGSGVWVTSSGWPSSELSFSIGDDVGMFEVLELRCVIEPQAAYFAAERRTDDHVDMLAATLADMSRAAANSTLLAEQYDQRFHRQIAMASGNRAMETAVAELWTLREGSPQTKAFLTKARNNGAAPNIEEHRSIFTAIKNQDAGRARDAMTFHLKQVTDLMLDVTELSAMQTAQQEIQELRYRYMGTVNER